MEEIERLTAGQVKFKIMDLERQIQIQRNKNSNVNKRFEEKENMYKQRIQGLRTHLRDLQEDQELLKNGGQGFFNKKRVKIEDVKNNIDERVEKINGNLERLLKDNQNDFANFYEMKIHEVRRLLDQEHKKKSIKVGFTIC